MSTIKTEIDIYVDDKIICCMSSEVVPQIGDTVTYTLDDKRIIQVPVVRRHWTVDRGQRVIPGEMSLRAVVVCESIKENFDDKN